MDGFSPEMAATCSMQLRRLANQSTASDKALFENAAFCIESLSEALLEAGQIIRELAKGT